MLQAFSYSSLFTLTSLALVVARSYIVESPVDYYVFVAWFCTIIVLRPSHLLPL